MNIPAINVAGNMINPHWIAITWPMILTDDTGGDVVISYGLEWN